MIISDLALHSNRRKLPGENASASFSFDSIEFQANRSESIYSDFVKCSHHHDRLFGDALHTSLIRKNSSLIAPKTFIVPARLPNSFWFRDRRIKLLSVCCLDKTDFLLVDDEVHWMWIKHCRSMKLITRINQSLSLMNDEKHIQDRLFANSIVSHERTTWTKKATNH